jgi:O-antigen/teichoic acid export membrane protein
LRGRKDFVIDSTWMILGQVIFALSTLIGVRLLSDLMPPAAFGEVGLLVGLLTLGRNLFAYPFLSTAVRYYPEVLRRGEVGLLKRLIRSFLNGTSALLAIVIVLVGVPAYGWKPLSLLQLPLMVGLVFVDTLRGLESDLFVAARKPRAFAIVRASESCLRVAGAVAMTRWLGPYPAMVLFGYLLGGTAVYAGLFLFGVERVGDSPADLPADAAAAPSRALRERIVRYSLPLIPIAIMDWVSSLSDRYFVGGLVGLDAAGIYIAAYGLMNQPFMVTQTTLELLFRTRYFDAVAANDRQGARTIFASWMALQTAICVLGVAAVAGLSGPIASICLGAQYQGASRIMPWIAAGSALLALYSTLEKVFHARQRTGWCLTLRASGAVLSVVVGLPLILLFGIDGAALAVPIYFGLQVVACIAVINATGRSEFRKRAESVPCRG